MDIPLMAAVCFVAMLGVLNPLYLHVKAGPHKTAATVVKALATALALLLAVAGTIRQPGASPLCLTVGLALCLAGDVLIVYRLTAGMGAFLFGHIGYIAAFCLAAPPSLWSLIPFAVFLVLLFVLFRRRFPAMGRDKPAYIAYAVVLTTMLSVALLLPTRLGATGIIPAVGAALFTLSDVLLARGMLFASTKKNDALSLTLYYLGQYVLALWAFLP